jgi:hypothetical protein
MRLHRSRHKGTFTIGLADRERRRVGFTPSTAQCRTRFREARCRKRWTSLACPPQVRPIARPHRHMCIPHTRHTNTNTHRDHERTYALSAESMGVSDNRAASASDYTWGDLGCSAPAAEASGDVPSACLQSLQGMLPGMLQTVDVTSSTGGFSHGALRPAEGEVVRLQDGINQEAIKLDKFEALREFIKRKVAAGMDAASAGRPIR